MLRASDDGRWLLAHRPRVSLETVEALGLSRLPPGTLGRSLYAHLAGNGLLRELVLPPSPFPLSDDAAYAKARWRETHDLRHVVTGLGTSVRDEVVLQAFQLGQFANRFAGLQMIVGPILSPCRPDRLVRDYARAVRAGHAAVPLAPVRWEDWLHRPVSEVRRALGVAPLGVLWP